MEHAVHVTLVTRTNSIQTTLLEDSLHSDVSGFPEFLDPVETLQASTSAFIGHTHFRSPSCVNCSIWAGEQMVTPTRIEIAPITVPLSHTN